MPPHTNVTDQVQKVYTKKDPDKAVFVEPGETIPDGAKRILQVTPEDEVPERDDDTDT